MSDLLAARSQMALSLAFHIIFAVIGIAMPLLMVIAEGRYLKDKDPVHLLLAKRWAKGTAVLFAVGAVSGTVLSFELGLLWPQFMEFAGPMVGMPFSMEGFAFFLEAIFLGIYLYGWDRLPGRVHQLSGVGVAICGVASAAFVVCANAWMNTPAGFVLDAAGDVVSIDAFAAMFNPAAATQMTHMVVASFCAVGFGVAGVHAAMLLKEPGNRFHTAALRIALVVAVPAAFLMPVTGHFSAEHVAEYQPVKFAAMEAHWETEADAAVLIGGWADEEAEETHFAIRIPYLLSLLAHRDPHAVVMGLSDVPPDERPPVNVVHIAFDIMVGLGVWMMLVGALLVVRLRRRPGPLERGWLKLLVATAPAGFIAIEAGWTVTEVGRQPWVIHGIMRTADAVTPMPHLIVPFATFSLLYVVLGVLVVKMLTRHVLASPTTEELEGDYAV